jgi:putative transposase
VTRTASSIEVDQGIKGEQVVAVMTRLAVRRGAPSVIRLSPEFVAKALDRAPANSVTPDCSRPGKPTDNAFAEPSTRGCAMNASTHIGSCRWPTRVKIEA